MERDEPVVPEAGWHLPGQRDAAAAPTAVADVEPTGEASEMILAGSVANPNRLRLGATASR